MGVRGGARRVRAGVRTRLRALAVVFEEIPVVVLGDEDVVIRSCLDISCRG